MKIKMLIMFSLFLVAIIGLISTVNAEPFSDLNQISPYLNTATDKPVNGKTKIYLDVYCGIGMSEKNYNSAKHVSKRKAEFNKINKYVISIKGFKPITYKKPSKGWKISNNKGAKSIFFKKSFSVKGNPNGKSYSLKIYDKKNKLVSYHKSKLFNGMR